MPSAQNNPHAKAVYFGVTHCAPFRLLFSCDAVSTLLRLYGLQPARLLCPLVFPHKNTKVGRHSLLQVIFPTQGSNPCLLHGQADSLASEPPGKPPVPFYSSSNGLPCQIYISFNVNSRSATRFFLNSYQFVNPQIWPRLTSLICVSSRLLLGSGK